MSAYGSFAAIYDTLMDDFDYEAWSSYYCRLLTERGNTVSTLCECACGTGSLSIPMAKRGISLVASDLSGEMLEIAAEKARKQGVDIRFSRQDMTTLQLPRPVDGVMCGCDGVNYLCSPSKVQAFFAAAFKALKPGGVFVFDVSTEYKLTEYIGDGFFGEERDDIAYLWSNELNPDNRTVRMDLTFFRRTPSGLYERFSETHRQRAHSETELRKWLADAGFTDIRVYGDQTNKSPKDDEMRIHFSAVRP